jgi:hypothetical protein
MSIVCVCVCVWARNRNRICGVGAAKPTPSIRLVSCLLAKRDVVPSIAIGSASAREIDWPPTQPVFARAPPPSDDDVAVAVAMPVVDAALLRGDSISVPLHLICVGRSGDKVSQFENARPTLRGVWFLLICCACDMLGGYGEHSGGDARQTIVRASGTAADGERGRAAHGARGARRHGSLRSARHRRLQLCLHSRSCVRSSVCSLQLLDNDGSSSSSSQ